MGTVRPCPTRWLTFAQTARKSWRFSATRAFRKARSPPGGKPSTRFSFVTIKATKRATSKATSPQSLTLDSTDVERIEQAAGQIVALQEKGLPLDVGNPDYLVGTLEKVKMSLIADATRNAHDRATEFARSGDAQVGAMRSASRAPSTSCPHAGLATTTNTAAPTTRRPSTRWPASW